MLKYHQAAYDLLTSQYIDPAPAIKSFEEYDVKLIYQTYQAEGEEKVRQEIENWRADFLAWTKLDLHQHPATFSPSNIEKLDALESKYQVKLPEAVREWYSLDIAPEIMSLSKAGYPPIFRRIEEIVPLSEAEEFYRDEKRPDLWYFLHAEYIEQGGEHLFFLVGENPNPPVYAFLDKGDYRELTPSFSQFIYKHFWYFHVQHFFPYSFSLWSVTNLGGVRVIPPKYWIPLTRMMDLFEKSPTGKYDFYNEHCRILALPKEEVTNSEVKTVDDKIIVGGSFHADSVEALRDLILHLWGENAPVFHIESHETHIEQMLETLKQDLLRKALEKEWLSSHQISQKLDLRPNLVLHRLNNSLNNLLMAGEIEAHPDNQDKQNPENHYRLKPKTNNQ